MKILGVGISKTETVIRVATKVLIAIGSSYIVRGWIKSGMDVAKEDVKGIRDSISNITGGRVKVTHKKSHGGDIDEEDILKETIYPGSDGDEEED